MDLKYFIRKNKPNFNLFYQKYEGTLWHKIHYNNSWWYFLSMMSAAEHLISDVVNCEHYFPKYFPLSLHI